MAGWKWPLAFGLALTLATIRGDPIRPPKLLHATDTHRALPAELFSIELPRDVTLLEPDLMIDYFPGDPNASGIWSGPRWRIHYQWWVEARTANVSRDPDGRPRRGTWVYRDNFGPSLLGQPGRLVVRRSRSYTWQAQLLTVDFFELEPSDSIAAQRLLASVRFYPKPPWR